MHALVFISNAWSAPQPVHDFDEISYNGLLSGHLEHNCTFVLGTNDIKKGRSIGQLEILPYF